MSSTKEYERILEEGGPSTQTNTKRRTLSLLLLALGIFAVTFQSTSSVISSFYEDDAFPNPLPHWRHHCGKLSKEPLTRARQLLDRYPLIDGHIDLPILAREMYSNQPDKIDLTLSNFTGHVDIPRLRAGGVGGFFWSVYVGCPDDEAAGDAYLNSTWRVRDTLEQIDIAKLLISQYKDTFELLTTSHGIRSAFYHGKIASLLGIEGGHQLGNSLSTLRQFHDLGVRYVTLTHGCHNVFADSCGYTPDFPGRWGGLSAFGKTLVKEMNRIGMIVDISHTSPATSSQVLSLSKAPPIFSHSSTRAIHDVARNVPDAMLRRIGKYSKDPNVEKDYSVEIPEDGLKSGNDWGKGTEEDLPFPSGDCLVMINFNPPFISEPDRPATLSITADHIDHVAKLAGKDHVGVGSDYDGITGTPEGLEDVSKFPYLVAELIKRGWTDSEIGDFASGNLIRILGKVEAVSAHLRISGAKIETEIYSNRTDIGRWGKEL